MIFDVKIDLNQKARCVAGGHLTNTPSYLIYSSSFSKDSVLFCFPFLALNDLDILSEYIQNAHLNVYTKEKQFLFAGYEWKYYQGRVVVIVKDLYGLKSTFLAWSNHL